MNPRWIDVSERFCSADKWVLEGQLPGLTYSPAPSCAPGSVLRRLPRAERIVLNLGEVNYIDSGGLGTLVGLHTTAQKAGATIKLANLTKRVGDLLQVTKLLTVFDVHESEYGALESFRTAA